MVVNEYLTCYKNYFWQWDLNGETITLTKGNTIAYTKFIADILGVLKVNGAPRFSALLIALAVTDEHNGTENYELIKKNFEQQLPKTDLKAPFTFIKELTLVPSKLKTGQSRQQLLSTLFWESHNGVSEKKANRIINKLIQVSKGETEDLIIASDADDNVFYKDILVFELLQRKFKNAQGLVQAMAQMPNDLPKVELDQAPNTKENQDPKKPIEFLPALSQHYKTYKVGNLIKSIWSGLNIPYHSIEPSSQPLGGVADISNKGDFHQLLISEFANDDITLLSRLANNEALYLEREIPPENNPFERVFLIDTSLRNWGTPKTVALAVSIAIAKHPKNNFKCTTILLGNNPKEQPLNQIEDVIDAQAQLSANIHAAQSLKIYFEQRKPDKKTQIFYIGAKDGLRHDAINRALSEYRSHINYKIILDQIGGISVYKTQGVSQRHVQDFKLNLDKLWQYKPEQLNTNNSNYNELDIENSQPPILVNISNLTTDWIYTENNELFRFSKDGVFLHHGEVTKQWQKGYEYIGSRPRSNHFEIGITTQNQIVLLTYFHNTQKIEIKNYSTNSVIEFQFPYFMPRRNAFDQPFGEFAFYNDHFYYTGLEGWKISITGSIRLNNTFKPDLCPKRLKFYKETDMTSDRHASVIRNLTKAFINERNNIVINSHEFIVNSSTSFKFKASKYLGIKHEATFIKPNLFKFKNGSIIYLNPVGYAVFKSEVSNTAFYIPSTLDQSTAVATNKSFAGLNYYLKGRLHIVEYQTKANASTLDLVRVYKNTMNCNLQTAKENIAKSPNSIIFSNRENAEQMVTKMMRYCKSAHIVPQKNSLQILNAKTFYTEHVQPFIDDIINS